MPRPREAGSPSRRKIFGFGLFRHALPQHVVAQFLAVRAQLAQRREFFLEHFVRMRLFMFLERLPVSDDSDMALRCLMPAQRAFIRNEAGELENLSGDEAALIPAVSILSLI